MYVQLGSGSGSPVGVARAAGGRVGGIALHMASPRSPPHSQRGKDAGSSHHVLGKAKAGHGGAETVRVSGAAARRSSRPVGILTHREPGCRARRGRARVEQVVFVPRILLQRRVGLHEAGMVFHVERAGVAWLPENRLSTL